MPSTLDVQALETKVKDMYRLVAQEPTGHFHDATTLAAVPSQAVDSFAGVGHFFDLADLQPGERVVDLGSGSGMDAFYAAGLVGSTGRVTGSTSRPSSWPRRGASLTTPAPRRSSSAKDASSSFLSPTPTPTA
jgi:cyclopropane fatty-acyl-phospholipid synthase-like methyltransferase